MVSYSVMSALITKRLPIAAATVLLFLLMSVGCSSLWPKPAETEPAGSESTVAKTPSTESQIPQEEPGMSSEKAESIIATPMPPQAETEKAVTETTPEKSLPAVATPAPAPATTTETEKETEKETETVTAEKVEPTATPSPQPQAEKPVEKEMKAPGSVTAEAPPKKTPPPLDLDSLEKRLRGTKAIGVFTKLALKNQVDDLLDKFRDFYQGRSDTSLAQLRQPFEMLIMKILALLQDSDPILARDLLESREAIWKVLSDREKFTSI